MTEKFTAYSHEALLSLAAFAAADDARRPALLTYVNRTGDAAGAIRAAAEIAYTLPAAHNLDLVVDSSVPGYAVRAAQRIVRVMVEDGLTAPSVALVVTGQSTEVLVGMLDLIRAASRARPEATETPEPSLVDLVAAAATKEGREALQQYLREHDVLIDALRHAARQAEKLADRVDTVDTAVSTGALSMARKLMGQVRVHGDIVPEDVLYFSTVGATIAPQVLVALLDILAAADEAPVAS